jgi:hypothetical protein
LLLGNASMEGGLQRAANSKLVHIPVYRQNGAKAKCPSPGPKRRFCLDLIVDALD